jgi:hypothetical protein
MGVSVANHESSDPDARGTNSTAAPCTKVSRFSAIKAVVTTMMPAVLSEWNKTEEECDNRGLTIDKISSGYSQLFTSNDRCNLRRRA